MRTGQWLGQFSGGFTATIPAHGSRLLLVDPAHRTSCDAPAAAAK
ncbi:MAG: hypothetical protein ACRDOA_21570 [Streptosporangiaceae bacterium]